MKRVIGKVTFACKCGSSTMLCLGAVRTEDDTVYFVYQCECGQAVPIGVDGVFTALFQDSPPKITN